MLCLCQITINNDELTASSAPYKLTNMSLITISKIKLYFLLPQV